MPASTFADYTTSGAIAFIDAQPEGTKFTTYVYRPIYKDEVVFKENGAHAAILLSREEALNFVGSALSLHDADVGCKLRLTLQTSYGRRVVILG